MISAVLVEYVRSSISGSGHLPSSHRRITNDITSQITEIDITIAN